MTFKRLFSYLKPYKKQISLVVAITIISSICTILTPKYIGNIISSLYQSFNLKTSINTQHIFTLITIILIFYLINTLSSFLENYIMSNISQKALNKLKNEANEKLSKLSMKYYDTHQIGDTLSRINNDINTISNLFLQTIPKIANYIIIFIGTITIMLTINIKLTLITLISLPLTLLLSKSLLKFSKKKYKELYDKYGYLNSLIQESYTNKEIISIYNNDIQISNNFKSLNKNIAKTNIKANLITSIISPLSSLINYAIYLMIILLGSKYVIEKKLLLGDIQSLIQYTKQLSSPLNSFSSLLASIQSSLASSERVFALLDEKEEVNKGTLNLNSIDAIEFKNVDFSYNDTSLIENFNLKINKGEKVAIIGETGSGKSTIINLLMNFYKINKGDILINNKSIYSYNLNSYYNQISLIPQETYLLNDTIENNLKIANTSIKNSELINICKNSNFFNIIDKLPNKFNEIINEEKSKLSEGEKQLLIFSRALIKNHSLLILDEATSNIDSKNEQTIQKTIDSLGKNKITIIIAHRLSTILKADKIIVMKNGKIIEIGNHSSLYKQKGEYFSYLQTL